VFPNQSNCCWLKVLKFWHSAPISKVIEYLPPNIPRILINRTVVHPSTSGSGESDNPTLGDDYDFRASYVFDAYLLGFCDDVTRAMARTLFSKESQKKRKRNSPEEDNPFNGRLLSDVLNGRDEEYSSCSL